MKLKSFILSLTVCCGALSGCTSEKQPDEVRVLYLGGQSEWTDGKYGGPKKFATEEERRQAVDGRMAAFGDLLRTYFDSVTVMRAADWRPEMSGGYDVTIFDGVPPKLEDKVVEYDAEGNITKYLQARYLPDDFSAASITIGSIGEIIGRRYGSKNDWYCLCLDADAHHMNLEHPIFKGPFRTTVTQTMQPTPEDAFHYQYYQDEPLPDSVMMWKVNTKGYKATEGYTPGMVSRPWGYADSPDCEVISSGVCAKTIDAVALGRHANFFTWGFIGSPVDMTEEAKVVFANAVAYMAQFNGQQPLARKYNDRIATREYVKELCYLCTRASYEERMKSDSAFYAERAKADPAFQIPPRRTYADYLKRYQGEDAFARLGENEAGYLAYYKENTPYFYGGKGSYDLVVDEDAKAWQIPNNDIRLLDKAVNCLEEGMEVERARRVLERYTLCEFTRPSEWRAWLDKYRDKIFFTESGGWFFLVGEAGAPGNDYKALERREQARAKARAVEASADMQQPTKDNPVVLAADWRALGGGRAEMKLTVRIMAGFHIYKEVGKGDPYLPLKLDFKLPDGASLGKAVRPAAKPFGNAGTTMYEEEVTLTQAIEGLDASDTVACKVSYQCCDAHVCLPPAEKEFTWNYRSPA